MEKTWVKLLMIYSGIWFDFLQDQGLDVIAEGLDTLKNMAHDMNEVWLCPIFNELLMSGKYVEYCLSLNYECCLQEVDRQVPLMDEIDDKVFSTFLVL